MEIESKHLLYASQIEDLGQHVRARRRLCLMVRQHLYTVFVSRLAAPSSHLLLIGFRHIATCAHVRAEAMFKVTVKSVIRCLRSWIPKAQQGGTCTSAIVVTTRNTRYTAYTDLLRSHEHYNFAIFCSRFITGRVLGPSTRSHHGVRFLALFGTRNAPYRPHM